MTPFCVLLLLLWLCIYQFTGKGSIDSAEACCVRSSGRLLAANCLSVCASVLLEINTCQSLLVSIRRLIAMTSSKLTEHAAKYPPVTGSDFWRRKMAALFQRNDIHKNGFLTKEDFEEIGDAMVSLNGLTSDAAKKAKGVFQNIWTNYYSSSSSHKSYFDEFLVKRLAVVNGVMREKLNDMTQTLFDALDVNGDGGISIKEYLNFAEACRMGRGTGIMVFQLLDKNDDGEITVDELQLAIHDFFLSEDPSSPYKLLWGPLPKS